MAFEHLSCDQLAYWLEMRPESVTVIDIRDPASFAQGHIQGSHHIDNGNVAQFIESTDKTKPLIVCCYHGNSSQGAAQFMSEAGFTETYSLDGGFEAWQRLSAKSVSS